MRACPVVAVEVPQLVVAHDEVTKPVGFAIRSPGAIDDLEVALLERDPDLSPLAYVRDVELETKYLLGKNFHRPRFDNDLGPYEFAKD